MWGDEWFFEAPHEREKGFLRLDSHIMSTPAIADIDGDGQAEIVIAASYFFDPDYYDDPVRPHSRISAHLAPSRACMIGRNLPNSLECSLPLPSTSCIMVLHGCMSQMYLMHVICRYTQEHKKELGEDVDVSKYVAGGIVVFNSRTRTIKWQQHLDLSTDRTAFKAYIQASPTLADINGDGKLEIIIGTNMVRHNLCSHASAFEAVFRIAHCFTDACWH